MFVDLSFDLAVKMGGLLFVAGGSWGLIAYKVTELKRSNQDTRNAIGEAEASMTSKLIENRKYMDINLEQFKLESAKLTASLSSVYTMRDQQIVINANLKESLELHLDRIEGLEETTNQLATEIAVIQAKLPGR